MRLQDRVDIVTADVSWNEMGNEVIDWENPVVVATLPAYVSFTSVEKLPLVGHERMVEQLRVIMEPFDFDPIVHRIRWRGTLYMNDGPPMVRLRGGEIHHLTIALKDVQG